MSSDRCRLSMLKLSPDWMLQRSSFTGTCKVVLALVLSVLELAGGCSLVVLFFLVMLPSPDNDDDDGLRLLSGAE